jgi:hypothetical protein
MIIVIQDILELHDLCHADTFLFASESELIAYFDVDNEDIRSLLCVSSVHSIQINYNPYQDTPKVSSVFVYSFLHMDSALSQTIYKVLSLPSN